MKEGKRRELEEKAENEAKKTETERETGKENEEEIEGEPRANRGGCRVNSKVYFCVGLSYANVVLGSPRL